MARALVGPAAAAGARRKHPQPRLFQLGANRLGLLLLALDVVVFLTDVILFHACGLSVRWATVLVGAVPLAVLFAVWLNFYLVPGGYGEWTVAELIFLVGLMVLSTNVSTALQYGAVAVGSPYADPWLARADAAIGVHVPTLAAWTTTHPIVSLLLTLAYISLLPQVFLTIAVLAAYRDRAQFWEFAFHFHVCLITTVAALMLWPAVHAPAHYGFRSTIDMTRMVQQIRGFHDGTMRVVRYDQLEGLVSFPSFHVAAACLVTWAVRHRRWLFVPIALVNAALIASTMLSGVHYAIDVIAAVPLVAVSLVLYRHWGSRLLPAEAAPRSSAARRRVT